VIWPASPQSLDVLHAAPASVPASAAVTAHATGVGRCFDAETAHAPVDGVPVSPSLAPSGEALAPSLIGGRLDASSGATKPSSDPSDPASAAAEGALVGDALEELHPACAARAAQATQTSPEVFMDVFAR
jgi:hypothetical protein